MIRSRDQCVDRSQEEKNEKKKKGEDDNDNAGQGSECGNKDNKSERKRKNG
jgi:hypothetical protein